MIGQGKIVTATIVMACATSMSRIAGLVRDVVVARLFGAGMVTDAFFMAFTIPNLLRRFFGEGSLTAAFVPIFSETFHQRGEEEAQKLADRCISLLFLVMLAVVAAGMIFSPWIVQGIGFGFGYIPGKLELTNQLNRLMFPYIGLVSILALVTGILNVRGHFFLPALSPLFLNLCIILSALTLGSLFDRPIFSLAVGVLVGGTVQLLMQFPVLFRYRIRFRLNLQFSEDPQLHRILRLMIPGVVGVAIYQINIIVSRLLASFLPDGSLSYLYYGQRLFEFPQGIFIVSLAQAALPMMSRQVAEDDQLGMQQSLTFALSVITLFTLPAIIGLILCAKPIYSLFFFSGEFDSAALENTALALICYAPGLIFVGYSRIASQTFYALKDTRTPVVVSFWTLLVNLVAGLVLMKMFGFSGLAMALTLASAFNAFFLLFLLKKKAGSFLQTALLVPILKSLPVCAVMGFVVYLLVGLADWNQPGIDFNKSLVLCLVVVVGVLIYLAGCYFLKVKEVHQGIRLLMKRK
jgi:putative peptidoglycan lipid II flippase